VKAPYEHAGEILVLDDEPANLKLLTALLTGQGYRVRATSSGAHALDSAAAKAPDVILLDVRMPEMDGYEVCWRLKADPRTRTIPVIFISALGDSADMVRGLGLGGADYIAKPFEPTEVLARVKTHVDLRRAQRHLELAHAELERRVEVRTAELAHATRALQEREERLRLVMDATSDGVWDYDLQTNDVVFSDRCYTMLGYRPGQFAPSHEGFRDRLHPDDLPLVEAAIRANLENRAPQFEVDFRIRNHAGEWAWIYCRGKVVARDGAGKPLRMVGSHQDITERKQAEQALRDSEHRLRLVVHNAPVITFVLDAAGTFRLADGHALSQFGSAPAAWVGHSIFEVFRDYPALLEDIRRALAGDLSRTEVQLGQTTFETAFSPYCDDDGRTDGLIVVAVNTTERTQAQARIRATLEEKDVLLREIFHRVKNNLQVIVSLLALQSRGIADPAVRAFFSESADRIRAMALVHELLYRSTDLARIPFDTYLRQLVEYLERQMRNPAVTLEQHLAPVTLGLETAIPCGLIVNELLVNAFKHGFPAGRGGVVTIGLERDTDATIRIVVADTGVGLPADFAPQQVGSLGWRLIVGLVNQIDGQIGIAPCNPTRIELRFADDNREARRYEHALQ
jgi:PAS domain S-box-containing protein